jgi:hypothetical protein
MGHLLLVAGSTVASHIIVSSCEINQDADNALATAEAARIKGPPSDVPDPFAPQGSIPDACTSFDGCGSVTRPRAFQQGHVRHGQSSRSNDLRCSDGFGCAARRAGRGRGSHRGKIANLQHVSWRERRTHQCDHTDYLGPTGVFSRKATARLLAGAAHHRSSHVASQRDGQMRDLAINRTLSAASQHLGSRVKATNI